MGKHFIKNVYLDIALKGALLRFTREEFNRLVCRRCTYSAGTKYGDPHLRANMSKVLDGPIIFEQKSGSSSYIITLQPIQ